MPRQDYVVCSTCGQPVPEKVAELTYEDPDQEENEYQCQQCFDVEFDRDIDAELHGYDVDDIDVDDLNGMF